MKINLLNKNDKKIFYMLIPIYKSILFYFTKFELIGDDNEVKEIVDGLNIKNRKARIKYVYDKSCETIDNLHKNVDICGFKNGRCYSQTCYNSIYINGCCRMCRYQNNKGCPTSNLACKLFNCSEVTKRYKVITYDDLKILKLLSIKNRFVVKSDYFSKRDDVLKDLYCYSLIFSLIRLFLC